MRWKKLGLVYAPSRNEWWNQVYAMMPTPYHIKNEGIIRVYFGITDKDRFGRTAFVDVDEHDPTRIVRTSDSYVLDIGVPGTFDDCGAVPSCLISKDDNQYLYYVGFQRVQKVPYMLFSGLATSSDYTHFKRYSQAPIIDRSNTNVFSNAAPYVLFDQEENLYKMWFWLGLEWVNINQKLYINAEIQYATSQDGLDWNVENISCITPNAATEFSVGRPWVIKSNGLYKMYYSVRYIDKLYRLAYAESKDGKSWDRKDSTIGIDVSESGWDSEMVCYPAVITMRDKTYLFYNGNNNGETGFGVAELIEA